jgi:hypothetical protein
MNSDYAIGCPVINNNEFCNKVKKTIIIKNPQRFEFWGNLQYEKTKTIYKMQINYISFSALLSYCLDIFLFKLNKSRVMLDTCFQRDPCYRIRDIWCTYPGPLVPDYSGAITYRWLDFQMGSLAAFWLNKPAHIL